MDELGLMSMSHHLHVGEDDHDAVDEERVKVHLYTLYETCS